MAPAQLSSFLSTVLSEAGSVQILPDNAKSRSSSIGEKVSSLTVESSSSSSSTRKKESRWNANSKLSNKQSSVDNIPSFRSIPKPSLGISRGYSLDSSIKERESRWKNASNECGEKPLITPARRSSQQRRRSCSYIEPSSALPIIQDIPPFDETTRLHKQRCKAIDEAITITTGENSQ